MVKYKEVANPQSCLNKAADDEPIFVLRAQDTIAPLLVRLWADLAALHGTHDRKLDEARLLAVQMERWPTRKFPD